MPGPRGNAAVQKGKGFRAANPMKTFKRILTYLKPFKGRLIITLLCMLVNVVANIAGTLMIGTAIRTLTVARSRQKHSTVRLHFCPLVKRIHIC